MFHWIRFLAEVILVGEERFTLDGDANAGFVAWQRG